MSDDQARGMRPETTSEHIARDMREGRFPEQSERQMVPVLASLPDEIQVWRSMDTLGHMGTWSTTRYPAEAVTYVPRADAQAAVALVVERAGVDTQVIAAAKDLGGEGQKNPEWAFIDYEANQMSFGRWAKCGPNPAPYVRLDLLLNADGLAAVEALRKERDHWETLAIARDANRIKAEADRDRLAAANAALEAKLARLVGAAENVVIAGHMGWEMDGVLDVLEDAVAPLIPNAALAEVQARDEGAKG